MTANYLHEQKAQNDQIRRAAQRAMFRHPDLRDLARLFAGEIEPKMNDGRRP